MLHEDASLSNRAKLHPGNGLNFRYVPCPTRRHVLKAQPLTSHKLPLHGPAKRTPARRVVGMHRFGYQTEAVV